MSDAAPFRAVLGSEWVKLRSLRSTWWCLAVYVDVAAGAGWLAAGTRHTAGSAGAAMAAVRTGFGFAQPALLVLGVLAMSAEFGSGMALASFAAVPRRIRVLVAKTVVVAGVCTLPTAGAGALCALAARTLVRVPGGVSFGTAAVLRPLRCRSRPPPWSACSASRSARSSGRRPARSGPASRSCWCCRPHRR